VNSNDHLCLGIDVGGTDVKIGLVDDQGVLLYRHRTSTRELGAPDSVFQYAIEHAHAQADALGFDPLQIAAVGLAVPGVLDRDTYCLREVVNLPDGWKDVPLLSKLERISQLPSVVVNDANAAAYAEHDHRQLGVRSLALVTLGTGIGCGVITSGNPYGGDHGSAGELGHIAIDFSDDALPCTCGSQGHLESYAGAAGVVRRANQAARAAGSTAPKTPRKIAEQAEQGDELCLEVIRQTGRYVGQAVGQLCQVLDPEVVLIGGAMTFGGHASAVGRRFLETIQQTVVQTTLVQVGGNVIVDYASLGNDAGKLGAASLARRRMRSMPVVQSSSRNLAKTE
tara:strand:+ start:399592 stop:400608 length:1017 start_codon:yes stop_codon:yes gene_type:complete